MAFAVQIAKGIFDLVRDDLGLVEEEIAAQNIAAIQPVAEISSYLLEGGGKRLRPALLLLAAGAAGYRGQAAVGVGLSRWNEKGTVNYNLGVSSAGGNSTIVRAGLGIVLGG